MNPTYSAAAEEYREKVQAFLAEKLPPNWQGIGALTGEALEHFITEWRATLFASGYLAPGWPVEFGGGGEEMAQRAALLVLSVAVEHGGGNATAGVVVGDGASDGGLADAPLAAAGEDNEFG